MGRRNETERLCTAQSASTTGRLENTTLVLAREGGRGRDRERGRERRREGEREREGRRERGCDFPLTTGSDSSFEVTLEEERKGKKYQKCVCVGGDVNLQ